uniref:Myb-like domain-containing protein n=1 Tax=Sparus aurata TaxID=8175 RepID=A0A671XHW1_SPAAU
MFRRSRFSIRPNVGTAGRTAATPQEAPSVNQEADETPKDVGESSAGAAVTDNKSVVTPPEKPTAPADDQNGEGSSSSAAVQRRKRFSIKPKVAPGRPSALARTPLAPVKAVSAAPIEVPVSDLDKPTTTPTAAPQGLQSPRRRRLSEESKQPKVQPKPTLSPSDSSGPSAVPLAEDSGEPTQPPSEGSKQLESTSDGPVKEVPSRLTDKVPPSLPDRESMEISEKAKTLVSSKSGLSLSPPAYTLSRLLNDPSDLQRLAKARKLRELLRQELHKEKKIKKAKARPKEYSLDPAKMTMRDLIRYLPMSNPMPSSLEAPENETVVPSSPEREESPEKAQEPEVPAKIASPREEEEEEEEEAAAAEEDQDDAPMVPQVKVAEDGSLIIDEESLTVEVQRAKGPNTIQDRDPIFERGSTTTYSSFRKGTYSKPWSNEETDMFFLAISMVGTDFSMICQLFPHRARSEIKNKFKKEERANAWRIDKAFRERRKLDIEYFSKLLEKILEVQKNRKKLKSLAEKNSPKKRKKRAKGKKGARKLSDVEEEDEEEEKEMPDLEEEGEKENERGTPVPKPKKKRKRKTKEDGSTEEPNDKKNKKCEKSSDQDEAYIPEETEAALPEDHTNSDMSEKTENAAKDTTIKPAKLSRGRAPKPLLPLGRKLGKKSPAPSTKAKDSAADKADESVSDKEQGNKDASPIRQANKRMSDDDDISSEEEDASVQPPRPTRYGRVPKPTKPLTYPAKDDPHSSASEATPASPAASTASAAKPKTKCTAKRGRSSKPQSTQESKKPKLVTLRASQSESSDEGYEQQWEEEELEKEQHPSCSKDSIAPAFVPASLRSPQPVISEVEETMEEDVIDFLSSEHTEVSEDESYNEAAQTLLTIGNMAHLSQSAQNLATDIQDHTTDTSVSVDDTIQNLEEEIASQPAAQEENSATSLMAATSGQEVAETSETVAVEELQNRKADGGDQPILESSDQRTGSDPDPTPQIEASPEKSKKDSPQTRKGRLSKVKPKPNLGQASRTAKSKSQPETNTQTIDEESHTVAPKDTQATETLSAAEEIPKIADSSQELSKDEISCIEVKLTEEPSGSQEKSAGQEKSGVATSDQSTSKNQSQCFSDTNFKSTDEILISNVHTIKNSVNNLVVSDTAVPESQGINIYSDPVQQSSAHPAPCVTPVEDLPVSQKEESEDASTCQTKKSRFQRVKPKPNLAKTSRTVHSKPQTTEDNVKTDSNPTANPNFHEKAIEVEAEPACTTSPEKPRKSTAPASDLIPSLDLGSTLTPADELPITEEKKTDVGVVGQVESGVATSDCSASENRNPAEAQLESRMEQDTRNEEDKPMSTVGTTESSCINVLTSDSTVPESQDGQGSEMDSATVQESSDHPASCVTPVKDPPASQKEVHEDPSTHQARKRFQRFKPKPNVAQTSKTLHSKTVTTKETVEKDSSPTTSPKFHEKTIINVETDPTCTISPEKPSQSTGPDSDWKPSGDLGSTVKPTEALSAIDEKKTDVAQVESFSATTGQRASENLDSEAQLEPSTALDTRDIKPTSEPIEEKLMTQVGTTETSCSNLLTLNSAILESQVGHEPNIDSAPIQESSDHPDLCVTPVIELPFSEKEKDEEPSTHEARKSRFQRVKPKPNLPQTSRAVRSKPQTTKDPVTHMQPVEKPSDPTPVSEPSDKTKAEEGAQPTCSAVSPERPSQIKSTGAVPVSVPSSETCSRPTEGSSSAEVQKTDAGSAVDSSLEGSEQNVPRRRQQLPKIKPNLGLSTRTTQAKDSKPSEPHLMSTSGVTSEQQPVDLNKFTEKDIKHLTSAHCSLERLSSTKLVPAESEKSGDAATSSTVVLTGSVLENKSSEKSTIEKESPPDKVVSAPASHLNSKRDITLGATETSTKPTDDPTAISDVQSSEDRSTETEIKTASTQSIPDPGESTRHPHSENESEAQGQHAVHQYPEMTENKKDDQSTDDNESKPADSSKSSRKAPQTRRGRLVKPKPNLGSKSQPPRPQVRNAKQSEADSATSSEGVDASLPHKPVSELQPHSQEPVEGAIEQHSNQSSPPKDAGSSLARLTQQPNQHDSTPNVAGFSPGCLTQVPDNCNQDASTSGTGGTQSQPSLTIFPDMLPEQMPSDPDEPFFILSLTEIPVCSSGDVSDPYLPVTDASMQQQSVTGESLAFAGDGPLSNVAVTVSPEESGETERGVKDEAAHTQSSSLENPVDPNEIPGVQPSKLPDTEENNDETEPPPTKQRLKGTARTAKVQVKPKTPRQKQARKTLPAKEEESTQDSELPGPSVQTKISNSLDVEKNTLTCGKDLDDCSTGDQTSQTRTITSQNRKPQDNSGASSKPPPGKAASKGPQVKTPRTAGKRSELGPVASTPHDVAPTPSPTQLPENTNSALLTQAVVEVRQTSEHSRLHSDATPSTSSGAAEVSASQQSDNVESSLMEDEPTSVSQYFLCDIFTDVEEG